MIEGILMGPQQEIAEENARKTDVKQTDKKPPLEGNSAPLPCVIASLCGPGQEHRSHTSPCDGKMFPGSIPRLRQLDLHCRCTAPGPCLSVKTLLLRDSYRPDPRF